MIFELACSSRCHKMYLLLIRCHTLFGLQLLISRAELTICLQDVKRDTQFWQLHHIGKDLFYIKKCQETWFNLAGCSAICSRINGNWYFHSLSTPVQHQMRALHRKQLRDVKSAWHSKCWRKQALSSGSIQSPTCIADATETFRILSATWKQLIVLCDEVWCRIIPPYFGRCWHCKLQQW